ncbi:unnamed protein product [Durusdinium trenchii]|uniref:Uncharacterized protein n=1 Tax=Durusdinium trenchii TaxID=1381693 RepID=A0ABP0R4L5_9DINO
MKIWEMQCLSHTNGTNLSVKSNLATYVVLKHGAKISSAEWRAKPLLIWYDYFSIPQLDNLSASVSVDEMGSDLQKAVESIPSYVKRCKFFVILAPAVEHVDTGELLSKHTWSERGWCRLEQVAANFLTKDAKIVVIESVQKIHIMTPFDAWMRPAGLGSFTVDKDRDTVLKVTKEMLHTKLWSFLAQEDLHSYRMLLNMQHVHLQKEVSGRRDPEKTPVSSSPADHLNDFMEENAFKGVTDRQFGWSPMCFAALRDDVQVLQELLKLRGNVNDRVRRHDAKYHIEKGTSLLHISAQFCCNNSLKFLLEMKAKVTSTDSIGTNPLHRAGIGNNAKGVHLLLEGGCDPHHLEALTDKNALAPASGWGSLSSIRALLENVPNLDKSHCIHFALFCDHASPEVLGALIEAGADINEKFNPHFAFWARTKFALFLLHLMEFGDDVQISWIASQAIGSTPLLCSLITCAFDASAVLIAASADVGIRNAKGKSAMELAKEVAAPQAILEGLSGRAEACCKYITDSVADKLWVSF